MHYSKPRLLLVHRKFWSPDSRYGWGYDFLLIEERRNPFGWAIEPVGIVRMLAGEKWDHQYHQPFCDAIFTRKDRRFEIVMLS